MVLPVRFSVMGDFLRPELRVGGSNHVLQPPARPSHEWRQPE
jgi:hypothetical protein